MAGYTDVLFYERNKRAYRVEGESENEGVGSLR